MNDQTLLAARPSSATKPGLLVVDDEPGIRNLLYSWMRRAGFAVRLAATGRAALGIYRRRRSDIDVVLLDVCMPGLDGPGTLAELRRVAPEVCCCFMSADLGRYTEPDLLLQGASKVVMKPFRLPDMASVLSDLARGRAERRAIASDRIRVTAAYATIGRTPPSFGDAGQLLGASRA